MVSFGQRDGIIVNKYGYESNIGVVSSAIPWSSNDELALLAKLVAEIRGHTFNLGVFAAQGATTVQQTLSTMTALASAVKALKRGHVQQAFRALGHVPGQVERKKVNNRLNAGDVSGAWLAMQYGWLPTISDVFAAWKAYSALTERRVWKVTASGRVFKEYEASSNSGLFTAPGWSECSVRYTYWVEESVSTGRSLGLTDPASIVWELLPWSFVVDWFIPIGTYLEVLNTAPYVTGRYCRSERRHYRQVFGGFKYNPPSQSYTVRRAPYNNYVSLTRTVGTSLVVPRPEFTSVSEALSPGRIKNAIALLHQKFR